MTDPEEIKKDEVITEDAPVQETDQTPQPTATDSSSQETPAPETTPVKEEQPVVDPQAITEEASKKAEERVMQRMADALGLTKADQDKAKDEGLVPVWEKEGRQPKSYKEVAEFSADLAEWKRQQAENQVAEEKKAQEEQNKQTEKQWNTFWDGQVDDLVASGKLPKIEDKDNPDDPGKQASKALWTKMYEVNQTRSAQGLPLITSLKEIYYEHYEDPNAQPAGADAPISMGKKAVSSGDKADYSYDEIHKQSLDQIVQGKK